MDKHTCKSAVKQEDNSEEGERLSAGKGSGGRGGGGGGGGAGALILMHNINIHKNFFVHDTVPSRISPVVCLWGKNRRRCSSSCSRLCICCSCEVIFS